MSLQRALCLLGRARASVEVGARRGGQILECQSDVSERFKKKTTLFLLAFLSLSWGFSVPPYLLWEDATQRQTTMIKLK